MPFVQRVVQPTFLSRSHANGVCERPPRTIVRAGAVTRQKSLQQCARRTTRALVHSVTNADPARPSVSNNAAATEKSGEKSTSPSASSSVRASTSCCCCQKQHCCNDGVGNNNNNNHNNNKNDTSKGIIGSCCNAKTNSLSSFSYSTADIDIDVVDDDVVDASAVTESGRQPKCRGVSLDNGERAREEDDESKEFVATRSGYGNNDSFCYSSCNGAGNSSEVNITADDDDDDEEDNNDATAIVTPPIVTGFELESISNITLSNALRQLASLVIIASDIFHNLNKELQNIGDRTRGIKAKIDALDKKASDFDPKLVTVPESDLGTFAQRKTYYQCDKLFHKELFTSETRPTSIKVLYEEAAKISQCRLQASQNGTTDSCTGALDELVCTSVFGKANRKMRTRIDAEIEIRLPAGIEDLRKWTSTEALGDVTVTPDCMNRVDASISTSIIIGDNGVLTPALSPSVLSADAVDAIYSINNSNDKLQIPNDINKDVPLNHRLPSPEEQCKLLALKYPAEIISVDTSGKGFERMCLARKSTTACTLGMSEANNLNDDIQTVSRRSRSRKVRGKRRNTIAGIDQKEIQNAANGTESHDTGKNSLAANAEGTSGMTICSDDIDEEKNKFGRSKSSDILKKESVALPYEKGKSTLTRLNSLKQWGRNRLKFITPSSKIGNKSPPKCGTQGSSGVSVSSGGGGGSGSSGGGDIDDECIVHELTKQKSELFEKEGRFSHERKPSYSSSEKSVSLASNGSKSQGAQKLVGLSSGSVKLRDTSSLNRQRRNGINGHNKDEPHSSSGNWSASSESGRTSIGSEITIQPKSSASNTSLNVSSFHPGSGPPSSIISRRRFLNTSASSSVTSEGTATPDLQVAETYNDDETSSAYSCDTEGYYTSFHMDSGLRTLKEEEPMSPLQTSSTHPSNYSFGSMSNQTVLTAENEYELFGRGSTSTTTSSAGTVCTTLLVNDHGPDVPERISSLSKLNKSNNSASSSTLERSYSSSTVGSTLERTGTIKRNALAVPKSSLVYDDKSTTISDSSPESQESEYTFATDGQRARLEQPLPVPSISNSEVEYSESSDLEGVERIERIKQKTAMTAKRIPSMCIITPTTSDDENIKESTATSAMDMEKNKDYVVNYATPYATVDMIDTKKDYNLNHLKRTLQHPLHNMLDKLKVVLPSKRKSQAKGEVEEDIYDTAGEYVTIADFSNNNKHAKHSSTVKSGSLGIYYSNDIVRHNLNTATPENVKRDETEYISFNELPYNIRQKSNADYPFAIASAVDIGKIDSQCAASGKIEVTSAEVLGASPVHDVGEDEIAMAPSLLTNTTTPANKGARVKMNSQGKIIYDSDSLKRRKGAHTTFAPGPYVKETESALLLQVADNASTSESNNKAKFENLVPLLNKNKTLLPFIHGGCANRKVTNVRPVVSHRPPTIVNMTTKCVDRPPPPLPPAISLMAPPSLPSPSSSSTSSTLTAASSASSSASSSTSAASTSTVLDEGYQRFSKIEKTILREKLPTANVSMENNAGFNRNAPVYWTLQNRRQTKATDSSRDDLYATPISRANRNVITKSNAELQRVANVSPIVPRNRGNFFTSTPTKAIQSSDSVLSTENIPSIQCSLRSSQKNDDKKPERFNTCSDRIGVSKTSLIDFKKLLLAKSAKNTPVQKMSAVELLKMNKREAEKNGTIVNGTDAKSSASQSLNSPMTLLDLSGSPKTFASRRMLRQGQFGSPSKSFAPKKGSAQWRLNSVRTDVISTTILEANSEEDHSNSSGGSNHSGSKPSSEAGDLALDRSEFISEEKFDLKKNIFLQTEENNFMKGELKSSFGKPNITVIGKYMGANLLSPKSFESSLNSLNSSPSTYATPTTKQTYVASELISKSNKNAPIVFATPKSSTVAMNKEANIFPALETAL